MRTVAAAAELCRRRPLTFIPTASSGAELISGTPAVTGRGVHHGGWGPDPENM